MLVLVLPLLLSLSAGAEQRLYAARQADGGLGLSLRPGAADCAAAIYDDKVPPQSRPQVESLRH